jgi:predicted DNA-binding transcriptional regulator AlpA
MLPKAELPTTHLPGARDPDVSVRDADECLLSRVQVCALTSLSYPILWELMRAGEFPAARRISPYRVGWLKSEIIGWMRALPVQVYKPISSAALPRKKGGVL